MPPQEVALSHASRLLPKVVRSFSNPADLTLKNVRHKLAHAVGLAEDAFDDDASKERLRSLIHQAVEDLGKDEDEQASSPVIGLSTHVRSPPTASTMVKANASSPRMVGEEEEEEEDTVTSFRRKKHGKRIMSDEEEEEEEEEDKHPVTLKKEKSESKRRVSRSSDIEDEEEPDLLHKKKKSVMPNRRRNTANRAAERKSSATMIHSDSDEEDRPSSRSVPTEKRRKMRANHSPDQQSSRAHRSSAQHSEHTTNLDASESEYSSMLEDEEASPTKKLTSSSSKLKIATMRADSTGQPLAAKKVEPSAAEVKVTQLKKLVIAAGARKMWKREFAGFEDNFARQQAHILRILRDLGMQGVPSLTKAKKLKEENEARQELADVLETEKKYGIRSSRTDRVSGREGAGAAGSSSHTAGAREDHDDGKESEEEVWSNGKLVERSKGRSAMQDIMAFLGDESESS